VKNPFIKASAKKKHLKIYLYGDSGVGKTYFSLTFPEVTVIDLEGGTDFFSDRFQFHVLDTKSFAEVMDAVNFLEKKKHNFKTLVIDPVTIIWSALQEGRLEFKVTNLDKAVSGEEKSFFTYKDWGQLKRFYSLLMTKLVNLPMHVILTSRLKDEYEIHGHEMTKIGVKPEAEKSTPYVTDIRFRLEVDGNGKRMAIFEKDRTGHFDRGTRIENPCYETFRSLVEENNNKPQAIHQDDNEAVQKDAAFFHRQERLAGNGYIAGGGLPAQAASVGGNGHGKRNVNSRSNGGGNGGNDGGSNGGNNNGNNFTSSDGNNVKSDNGNNGGNGQGAIPVGLLLSKFTSLGLKGLLEHYKAYCFRKYKVISMNALSYQQREEQKSILQSCQGKPQRKADFEAMLREVKPVGKTSAGNSSTGKPEGFNLEEGMPDQTKAASRNDESGKENGNTLKGKVNTVNNPKGNGTEKGPTESEQPTPKTNRVNDHHPNENQQSQLPPAPTLAAATSEAQQPAAAGFNLF